ncbi:helix-turn-helix transcriptional regulator [Frankia nepalensis]|uniref:helix-turn-helix transcriptional regulator n=1 Tax=Frankia nepalensis TaxID=1836974 RepID=UPI0027DD3F4E|nr:WYL domain-containing protein [Frankia nepalensis]
MSRRRLERLLNLTMCLMATSRFLTVSEIGDMVEGYEPGHGGDEHEAFRRMFERDKQYLRDLGIPLETGADSFGDEVGYRIRRDDYALPEILLSPDEAAALALAARLWSTASLAAPAASALRKLAAGGATTSPPPGAPGRAAASAVAPGPAELFGLDGLEPRVDAAEPAFEPCLAAVQARQAVRFPYRKPGEAEPTDRLVEPWGVLSWRGRWYLAGHDRRRDAPRVFRLSRVAGPVRPVGPSGAVRVPDGIDVRAMVTRASSASPDRLRAATLAVRLGAGHALRRRARPVPAAEGGTHADRLGVGADMDLLRISFADVERMARWAAGYGADVVVLDPPDLRAEVVRRLTAAADAAASAAGRPRPPAAVAPADAEQADAEQADATGPGQRRVDGPAARPRAERRARQEAPSDDRLSRLLALVPWLRARPGVSVDEAAAAFGITPRQLRDDLDLLFLCGLPGGAPGDLIDISYEGGQITVVDPQTLDRPLRLTVDEATALVVAARALADLPGLAGRAAVARAVERVERAIGSRPAEQVRVKLDAPNEVLAVLQRALRERRRVHLRYLVWSRDEVTERDVDPMRLLATDGHWYLEGWCHQAEAVRMFRLDGILGGAAGVRLLEAPAAPPPTARARDTSAGIFTPGPGDLLAVVDLAARARWPADHYPVESTTELPDGGLRMTLYATGTAWLRRLLLGLGGDARVVGPPALATEIHDAARKALTAYDDAPAGWAPTGRPAPAGG